jgi:hypothetical protein
MSLFLKAVWIMFKFWIRTTEAVNISVTAEITDIRRRQAHG